MSDQDSNASAKKLLTKISALSPDAAEVFDLAFDQLLDDGLLKDIPVFGWAVKAVKQGKSIRDALFARKLLKFLEGAKTAEAEFLPIAQESVTAKAKADKAEQGKTAFQEKFAADGDFRQQTGETLLQLIERHERIEKSEVLGRLFAALLAGRITHEGFLRLSSALDKIFVEDLAEIERKRPYLFQLDELTEEGLDRCGLMRMKIEVPELDPRIAGNGLRMKGEREYELNDLGKTFLKYAFATPADPKKKSSFKQPLTRFEPRPGR